MASYALGRGQRRSGHRNRFAPDPDAAKRAANALRLCREGGLTFREIAEAVGYASQAGARHAVYRSLAAIVRPQAEELRRLMDERYETVSAALMRTIVDPPPVTQVGKVVRDEHGRPVPDRDQVTRAAAALVKVDERRAKLFGLDAPKVSIRMSLEDIDAEIARVKADLGIVDGDDEPDPEPMLAIERSQDDDAIEGVIVDRAG